GGAGDRNSALHLRFELVCVRSCKECPILRGTTSDPNTQSIWRDQDWRRISLLDVLEPLPDPRRSTAVFHSVWSAAASRSGDSSIHTAHLRWPTDRSIWRWHHTA